MFHSPRRFLVFVLMMSLNAWAAAWIAAQNPATLEDQTDDSGMCPCDHSRYEMMAYPMCSLCWEAEAQPADVAFFFLKDIDPRKPNRWLILPRVHTRGMQSISELNDAESRAFWTAAVEKAKSLWGDKWGLAVNGDGGRTQCHAHAHIGKLLEGVEDRDFLFKIGWSPVPGKEPIQLKGPVEIKAPAGGTSYWIHPYGAGLHLHIEDKWASSEFVLMR